MTRRHVACAIVMMSVWMTASGTASAQGQGESTPAPATPESGSNLEEARVHYERAIELYNEDSFEAALVEIRRAYDIAPSYKMLYNIGHIQRARKDFASALQAFERYLEQGKDAILAGRRAEVEKQIATLRTRVATLEIVSPVAAATIAIDDVNVGNTPLERPITVNPGRRKIVASKQGYASATVWAELAGADAARIEVTPTTLGDKPSAPVATTSNAPMIVAWSVTGGLAVATAIFGGIALSKSSDLKDQTNTFQADATPDRVASDLDSSKSTMRAFSITTDVLAGLTLASAGVSLYLTLARPSTTERGRARSNGPDIKVGLGRLDLSGSF